MKTHVHPLLAACTFILAGCVSPPPPADVAHVKLERVDSPVVRVERLWLARQDGGLVAVGEVSKNVGAEDTTQTHLDVTVLSLNGAVLRESLVHFEPAQIPWGHRMHRHSRFNIPLTERPAEIGRIEVRAHEGAHP